MRKGVDKGRRHRHLMVAAEYQHTRAKVFRIWQHETCA
jgi:hypothetical protein